MHVSREAVTDAVNRADPGRARSAVVNRLADLVHERLQARFGDERLRPEACVDRVLGDGASAVLEQEQQQIECFSREVHRLGGNRDGAGVGVDGDATERVLHG